MKNINKRTEFEKQWEEVFKDVEMDPPESVWNKIDAALSRNEAGYFKHKAFIYKLLAAASIAFALGVGIFSINYFLDERTNGNKQLAGINTTIDEDELLQQAKSKAHLDDSNKIAGLNDQNLTEDNVVKKYEEVILAKSNSLEIETENSNKIAGINDQSLTENNVVKKYEKVIVAQSDNREIENEKSIDNVDNIAVLSYENKELASSNNAGELREFYHLNEILALGLNTDDEVPIGIEHIFLIPIMPRGASKRKEEKEFGLFLAGLNFSTGVFDPNFQQAGSANASSGALAFNSRAESVNDNLASLNTVNKDFLLVRSAGMESQPEIAFSYGANVGFKLSRRIIVQTGIAYRKANTTVSTTGFLEESGTNKKIPIVASYQYQFEGLSSVNPISETELNNQYEFASIPIRAGYVLIDKKLNLALMAGISSEFFLGNNIEDESNDLSSISNSPGKGSPFKSVYFNGSLGTMLGYTIAKSYVITVEPSYRFAVNSFTREDFYLNSYPSSFMLSFGVAYNFK